MGKLIIDGNSVFEIDEECVKRRKNLPKSCDIKKYMTTSEKYESSRFENKKDVKNS